tara:strand:- start:18194 stop:18769 length:576 start_codon:yes stop_codon:yes gene_type:complete
MVDVISYENNRGKAEAVRKGILECSKKYDFNKIGFLDADLSISLDDALALFDLIKDEVEFCFYSRINDGSNEIKSKFHRKIIGKFIRTIINKLFPIDYYDTQCGCKIFSKELASQLFQKKFISKWLFDIEIFCRLFSIFDKKQYNIKVLEKTVIKWIDGGNSKVKFSYFFKMWVDFYKIYQEYDRTIRYKI